MPRELTQDGADARARVLATCPDADAWRTTGDAPMPFRGSLVGNLLGAEDFGDIGSDTLSGVWLSLEAKLSTHGTPVPTAVDGEDDAQAESDDPAVLKAQVKALRARVRKLEDRLTSAQVALAGVYMAT